MVDIIKVVIVLGLWGLAFYIFFKMMTTKKSTGFTPDDYLKSNNCNNCQFLVKSIRNAEKSPIIPLDSTERQKVLMDDYEFLARGVPWELSCFAGEWKADVFKSEEELRKIVLDTNRKKCYFTNFVSGKNIDKALEEAKNGTES